MGVTVDYKSEDIFYVTVHLSHSTQELSQKFQRCLRTFLVSLLTGRVILLYVREELRLNNARIVWLMCTNVDPTMSAPMFDQLKGPQHLSAAAMGNF